MATPETRTLRSRPRTSSAAAPRGSTAAEALARQYRTVRAASEALARRLTPEDQVVQSMPDVSPTKWHLAHVSWFFETFVLKPGLSGYRSSCEAFEVLFNSYYNGVGKQFPRPRRGLLSRPTVGEVLEYRAHVDAAMSRLFEPPGPSEQLRAVVTTGLHHEQQHQELLLMDIKHVFSQNPLYPAYREPADDPPMRGCRGAGWVEHPGGAVRVGHDGDGFAFDNEIPRHRAWLEPFRIADRLVTNAEYLAFVEDGGYRRPELWLADGWTMVQNEDWRAPLYWVERAGTWHEFTLSGLGELKSDVPVVHVSYHEAHAYAEWSGKRLPTEQEWEAVAATAPRRGHFVEAGRLHPAPADGRPGLRQLFGDAWEWTRSPYAPYPGYRAPAGAIGEYNGKFMCNQFVVRGGACVTPASHVRPTYRNFFYPHMRWQFAGIRLAEDV